MFVVDAFEAVEIDREHRHFAATTNPRQRLRETIIEQSTVRQSGEWVVRRLVQQFCSQRVALADVF